MIFVPQWKHAFTVRYSDSFTSFYVDDVRTAQETHMYGPPRPVTWYSFTLLYYLTLQFIQWQCRQLPSNASVITSALEEHKWSGGRTCLLAPRKGTKLVIWKDTRWASLMIWKLRPSCNFRLEIKFCPYPLTTLQSLHKMNKKGDDNMNSYKLLWVSS
jgi:hypothetical protein